MSIGWKRKIRRAFAVLLLLWTAVSGCALGGSGESARILVVYFSRAGENYEVGVVEKGNTAIVAEIIAEKTGADLFEIVPVSPYPESYQETLALAQEEKTVGARPAYTGDVSGWDSYDTVFLGYPIWWGDLPMVVYTFLGNHDWTGKTVIPFDTNAGSGLAGTEATVARLTGAETWEGLAVEGAAARNDPETVEEQVRAWLEKLGR